jgi:hypothetical protein
MIAIQNDSGLTLDLLPGQNLVTEQAVAWLSDDELPGEFSYAIDAPLNENNKRFVQQGYRPDSALPQTKLPVQVQMDGTLYRRCTYKFRINQGKLTGNLLIDSSEFYDQIRNLSLLEAVPDRVALGDGLVSTPPVNLAIRLQQIAALPPGQFPCTFFPIRNISMLEDDFNDTTLSGFVRNDYVNAWEPLAGGGFGFPLDLPNMPKFGYLICPQFYLSWVLERIMALAGYTIESEWLYSAEVRQLTIENLTAMSMALDGLVGFIQGHIITAGMFLPEMTVSDFLKAVKGRFGLVFTYTSTNKICRITQYTQAVQAGPAIDLTEFQTGPYSSDLPDESGFAVTEFVDSGDALYKDGEGNTLSLPAQITGLGQTKVTLKAGTSQLIYTTSPLGNNARWFVPTVQQAGNVLDPNYKPSNRYLTKNGKRPNDIGLKFLYYRGMTTDSAGNPYPLGTPDDRDGRQVVVGSALTLDGQNGAWRSYLSEYYYFRDQTQRITQRLRLPVSVLAGLQLHRAVSLSIEDRIRRSYLISKIRAQAPGRDGIVDVQLEVLTLPSGIEKSPITDAPRVWVEFLPGAQVFNTGGGFQGYTELTVKTWQDANRSKPAIVTNLLINIRMKRRHESTVQTPALLDYQEYIVGYYANGSTSVIDPALHTSYPDGTGITTQFTYIVASIDPGDGYNILV